MMKRLRTTAGLLAMVVALLLVVPVTITSTGCSTTEVAPGNDPFVVDAEKDIRTSFNVVDAFLSWELANRASVGSEVTAAADTLRLEFPRAYEAATASLRAYKVSRTPDKKADVQTWLATLNTAFSQATRWLPADKTAAAKNASTTK